LGAESVEVEIEVALEGAGKGMVEGDGEKEEILSSDEIYDRELPAGV